ncbi:cyclin-domain-containing protein [Lipomyces kononenkoae]|uniref:Cyclin-domain-containing protein n=1 Tax=Lipomyces kononenkoae TaxID=34357 RepID=A0ACC3T9W9_LIPKO
MPPLSPFSLTAAPHLYPFSFPTPPPELPLSSSSSSGSGTTQTCTADLAQYRLRSHAGPSSTYSRSYNSRSALSSPPRKFSTAARSADADNNNNIFAPATAVVSSPCEVLMSPAPVATLAMSSSAVPAAADSTTNEDAFASMAANISCLFWFTPTQTLVHCATHNARLPLLAPVCLATPEFRLFAAAMLSRTQVSRTVVALALLYIYRLKLHAPSILGTPGSEYRVFTIALVLANKFLDDNTYTNKTWAQVSKLPVAEIGVMEVEFLKHIDYDLAVSTQKWSEWSDLLACFARARNAARFACVSLPGSPVSHQPPPPPPPPKHQHLLQSPSPQSRTSRKRKMIVEDAVEPSSLGPKRFYAQPQHGLPQHGLMYNPPTTSSASGILTDAHHQTPSLAIGPGPGMTVLPKPKGVVLPLTPTLAYPGTAMMRPIVLAPSSSIEQIPLLVKNTYAMSTYAVAPAVAPAGLGQPVPVPVAAPEPAPAPAPALVRALAAVQPATRANPFVYPVVDKHYVPVPRLLSVRQLHPAALTDPGRW